MPAEYITYPLSHASKDRTDEPAPQRLACFPLQAAVDEPLLYESWGKKQTYILAFTPTEVVDVTEHYTRQVLLLTELIEGLLLPSYLQIYDP